MLPEAIQLMSLMTITGSQIGHTRVIMANSTLACCNRSRECETHIT